METYAFWFYCLVAFPLALEALAGPIVLEQFGLRVLAPALVVVWLAPIVVLYYVFSAPEILIWMFPLGARQMTPPLKALICYTLPVWLALLGIWLAARFKRSLLTQSLVSAAVQFRVAQATRLQCRRRRRVACATDHAAFIDGNPASAIASSDSSYSRSFSLPPK